MLPLVRAQSEGGEIRLLVADPAGLALPSASGTLVSDLSHTRRAFVTDARGRFAFERLPFGVYRLTVAHPSFQNAAQLIEVRSIVPHDVEVRMAIETASTQVSVTASATLLDTRGVGAVYTSGAQQLAEQQSSIPARGLLDLVNMQPGWLFEGNAVLHPRGSEYQTLFVVDGIALDENRSPGFAPELNLDAIDSVSVLTAAFPAELGRKLGGVVEVTTAKDLRQGFHGAAQIDGGSFGTAGAALDASYGWTGGMFTLSGYGDRTDRYLDPPVLGNFNNSAALDGLAAAWDADLSPADRVGVSAGADRARFEVPNENLQQSVGQRQDRDTAQELGRAAWTHVISPALLLSVRASFEHLAADLWSNQLSTPIVVAQQRQFRRTAFASALSAEYGHHDMKFGGDALYTPVSEALQYQITDPLFFDPGTPLQFIFSGRRPDSEQSLFAQDSMRYGNLTVSAGVRLDRYSFVVKDTALSPRLGAAWSLPRWKSVLRVSWDRVFITPAMENLLLVSSPQVDVVDQAVLRIPIQPSRGNLYEAGFSRALLGASRLDVSFYRRGFSNYADDDVFLNTGVSFPIAFNRAVIRGVDLKLDLPRWGRLSGFVSYSNMLGIAWLPVAGGLFLDDDAADAIGATGSFPISQDQRNTVRALARYQLLPRLWISAGAQYGSGLPAEVDASQIPSLTSEYGAQIVSRVNFSAQRVRPNFSLDASLGADVWRRESRTLTFQVAGENLSDRLNLIDFDGLFSGTAVGPPRSVNARLRFTY